METDKWVEAKRRHVSADRVDAQIRPEREQVAVTALPVERQHLDAAVHDALHENEGEVGLAGTASPGNQDVFLESVAL